MAEEVKKEVALRLEFIHKPTKRCCYRKTYPFLIQNEPFEYGLRIKNIGDVPLTGASIKDFRIRASDLVQITNRVIKIKALNPDEEYEIYFDRYTLWHEGSISTECNVIPDNEQEEILTYQYHRDHDVDERHKINKWWHDYYCQSQQQLLQTRTNHLILLLTVMTVLEAVFGLNEILKSFSGGLAWFFSQLQMLFSWLAK